MNQAQRPSKADRITMAWMNENMDGSEMASDFFCSQQDIGLNPGRQKKSNLCVTV